MSVDTSVLPHSQIGLRDFIASPVKKKVPNHLLDTKIYAVACDNEIFHCRPSSINFQGFKAGGRYSQTLRIINVSSECQRLHVIPPSSDVFTIKYNKLDSLVPGMYLEVSIEFVPHENIYHHDCVRIHSKAAVNLTIPINAYLTMDISTFPNRIQFTPTQVGHNAVKKVPLRNDAAIDFDFQIVFIKNHAAINVTPLYGFVPANKYIDILIKYSPTEYCTACANIQILISQFNYQPYYCEITGTSEPGIATKLKLKDMEVTSTVVDPQSVYPLGRVRAKRLDSARSGKRTTDEKEIVKDGVRFPINLNGHSAVSYVLSQQAGKLRAKDLKNVIKGNTSSACNKQEKEAIFEHLVSKNIADENRNQMRWGVKLGEPSISELYRKDILKERVKAMKEYLLLQGECDTNVEFKRLKANAYEDKTRRPANEHAFSQPTFDMFLNDDWQKRHMVMGKFIQAARKIIWISRATKSLNAMSIHLQDWRHGNFKTEKKRHDESNKEKLIVESVTIHTIGTTMQPFGFPENTNSRQKDDMAIDALEILPVKETAIVTNTKVPIYNLKVPLQYKLLHYNEHPVLSNVCKYVQNTLARKLRTGPEKKVENETSGLSLEKKEVDGAVVDLDATTSKLTLPSCFLQAKVYHPLHIFNPLPGVHAHAEELPYSEIDDDCSLSPLSPAMSKRLDRESVIPGVMNWKRFPSQGLVAMSTTNLYNVYVPRWSDPFSDDIVPITTPVLLDSLPDDDQLESGECDDFPDNMVPNMKMVSAEFKLAEDLIVSEDSEASFSNSMTLPTTNNPQSKFGMTSREKMKEELNLYLRNGMNDLGTRLRTHHSNLISEWSLDKL